MNHLTRAELVDAVEGRAELPDSRARHLEACARCRAEADALRAVIDRAAADTVPEPSPLFWDHFAARVSEAVRNERIAAEPRSWSGGLYRPLTTIAVTAVAIVAVIVTIVWRATLHAPSFPHPQPEIAARATTVLQPPSLENMDADERWAIVRAAAEDLEWEEVRDAGIAAGPGDAEGVALELTADERLELARLIDQEMKRNGV